MNKQFFFLQSNFLKKITKLIRKNKTEFIIGVFSVIFSSWLMFVTFSHESGNILISVKAWSDFASHIPLIRSFSLGDNFPPQYPLFPGSPIRYHFLFYLIAGLLEKIGFRLDYALNIPSIIGFSGLIIIIYALSKLLFKSKTVGVLSAIFFLFNGSLSFLYLLKDHPLFSGNFIIDVISNKNFSSFAPYYGDGIVSAFWNLNIYTNQRHLAFSYALSLFIIYIFLKQILKKKKISVRLSVILGIISGISFMLNMAVFAITTLIVFILFILFNKNRLSLLTFLFFSAITALPSYINLQSIGSSSSLSFYPGYLINNNLTFNNFFHYWFYNIGLHLLLIPLGFFIAPKPIRKIFIVFLSLFIFANLFKFSSEIAANHKFFNYFMIVGVMFSARALTWLWNKKTLLKPVAVVLTFFLILSGIIDFFPIYNDNKLPLADYNINPDIKWIKENTPTNAVFLNTDFLYTTSSLAGRKIFLGWPYFAWSQGYDTNQRGTIRNLILTTDNKNYACALLKQNKIDFIEVSPVAPNPDNPAISTMYFDSFVSVYKNPVNGYRILNVQKSCQGL